jgi:6-phosphofructokinase 2
MRPIVTLTVNPAIDAFCVADEVVPVRKIRTRDERYAPGGGGINVARVVRELGGEAVAFYIAGGVTGHALEGMVEKLSMAAVRVPIAGLTRVSHVVFEISTGQEFRFTPEGPEITEEEWIHCLEVLSVIDAEYVIASGSLARGMPVDFYARVARQVKERGGRVVIDTSGAPLHWALEEGVHIIKPSRRELEHLLGRKASTPKEEEAMALEAVRQGRAEIVALTLGAQGAILATRDGIIRLSSPAVDTKSSVGAGDAFLGAMIHGLATGKPLDRAFAYGVAAGAATAATAGTSLPLRDHVDELYAQVKTQLPPSSQRSRKAG